MEENNSNKVFYRLNLNFQRITMLIGFFCLFAAGFFILGAKTATNELVNENDKAFLQDIQNNANVNHDSVDEVDQEIADLKKSSKDSGIIEPLKSTDMVTSDSKKVGTTDIQNQESIIPVHEDPFIKGPSISNSHKNSTKKSHSAKENTSLGAGSYYTIQVAAFSKETDANRMVVELRKINVASRVERSTRFFLVRSGKSSVKQKLQDRVNLIQTKLKVKPYIVKKS